MGAGHAPPPTFTSYSACYLPANLPVIFPASLPATLPAICQQICLSFYQAFYLLIYLLFCQLFRLLCYLLCRLLFCLLFGRSSPGPRRGAIKNKCNIPCCSRKQKSATQRRQKRPYFQILGPQKVKTGSRYFWKIVIPGGILVGSSGKKPKRKKMFPRLSLGVRVGQEKTSWSWWTVSEGAGG